MSTEKKMKLKVLIPVLLCYVVMGFVDIVGVSTGYAKRDFNLSPEMAQLIPSMVFIWFFFLSIPIGVAQNNFGKTKMLILGIGLTSLGMFLPFIIYSFISLLCCFILLGIGNTIIQVASNPLLQDVVAKEKFSSYMSLSQFIKAISSLLGPIIVTLMVSFYGNWKLVFLVYGCVSVLSGILLVVTDINESKTLSKASFKSSLGLLKNPFVASMVLAIFLIVGLDVGMNTNIQSLLIQKFGISLENASLGISLYFAALMISRFAGAIILTKINNRRFLYWSSLLTIISLILLIFSSGTFMACSMIVCMGLFSGNLFPLIFSVTISKMPDRANELSGLMIMAVVGGAVVPPVMGFLDKSFGIITSFGLLVLSAVYIFSCNLIIKKHTS